MSDDGSSLACFLVALVSGDLQLPECRQTTEGAWAVTLAEDKVRNREGLGGKILVFKLRKRIVNAT